MKKLNRNLTFAMWLLCLQLLFSNCSSLPIRPPSGFEAVLIDSGFGESPPILVFSKSIEVGATIVSFDFNHSLEGNPEEWDISSRSCSPSTPCYDLTTLERPLPGQISIDSTNGMVYILPSIPTDFEFTISVAVSQNAPASQKVKLTIR